ncbi:hypothetical protein AB0F71_04520 [Kitasatospora sp. NPDC028055]|uniref:hypothetical protein n=1 Tax=Kitasatospora sp. NPDC028055 TaxID=3155653 RepID=UPI0033E4ABA1
MAQQRRFVDRLAALEAFRSELEWTESDHADPEPRVLNLTGVGGIGKSRLLREFRTQCADGHRTALLDLQNPVMRQQEDALAALRVELGSQGVQFDRFDIAYAVLWQRLHPHLRINRKDLPFVDASEVLTQVVDELTGLPVFGSAVGLVKLTQFAVRSGRRRRTIRQDETLQHLDGLSNADLVDAVTFLFAEELRDGSRAKPYVVFVDAFEALVPTPVRSGRVASADAWLRDLIAQLDRGLVVVASREPLGWNAYDPAWAQIIRSHRIAGLPMEARLELLEHSGIGEGAERSAIAEASVGLPFYLHLAIDTRTQQPAAAAGRAARTAVSAEEILQRFLAHVAADEIRLLEVLSAARQFDYPLFRHLARSFDLPGNRLVWEALTSYSFVHRAEDGFHRLHQLMLAALRGRLSPAAQREIHTVLFGYWEHHGAKGVAAVPAQRTEGETAVGGPEAARRNVRALQEAVYHGLRAQRLSGPDVLDHADRALRHGGRPTVEGILRDLRGHLAAGPAADPELSETALCLETEAAVLMGDASTANHLTPEATWPLATTVGARLAVAAANGRRIAGRTAEALSLYGRVWDEHDGATRLTAGLWAADLHMCQGRFLDADSLAARIQADAPDDAAELRGDVARLRHLAHRFAFDWDASLRHLHEAEREYQRAGSLVGSANILVNRAELLALTDPGAGVREASAAIEVQQGMGALHELGKAYTALAGALLNLGRTEEAAAALQSACHHLERAHYRSGRARAELFRAHLHARRGDGAAADRSARWAIAELETAEVYPTLVLAACLLTERLGTADDAIERARSRARAAIQPIDSLAAVEDRMARVIFALVEGTP